MKLSIIIPVLNEEAVIQTCLDRLQLLRARGIEVIVVDGGSTDATMTLAIPLSDKVISSTRGRARQMNTGAAIAGGDILLFLHADTILPGDVDRILQGLSFDETTWGRFDVRFSAASLLFSTIAYCMNLRSRLTGIATGDQSIFVSRQCFIDVGGFPAIDLMEDIAISKNLRRIASPVCLREKVTTSSRRWEKHGPVRTILRMWALRLFYFLGGNPARLARYYD